LFAIHLSTRKAGPPGSELNTASSRVLAQRKFQSFAAMLDMLGCTWVEKNMQKLVSFLIALRFGVCNAAKTFICFLNSNSIY